MLCSTCSNKGCKCWGSDAGGCLSYGHSKEVLNVKEKEKAKESLLIITHTMDKEAYNPY
jgi:hypothetical protein